MTTAICLRCNRESLIHAKGLCAACYTTQRIQNNPISKKKHNKVQARIREENREEFNKYHREYYHKMKGERK
jgi:ribosomal protein L37E